MIRDRLMELQAGQDELDGGVALPMEVTAEQAAMNLFFTQMEEVLANIRKIEAAVTQVRKKHSQILSSTQNETDVKNELDDLTADIKRCAAKVNKKLKELVPKEEDENENQRVDFRIRKTQHGAATRQFLEAMTQYHQVQEEYRDRCRETIRRRLQITGKDPTEEELDDMLEKDNLGIFTQGIITETLQAKKQLADLEERHQEIMKLEASLRELHDLFIDISVLVQSQGETIDNIASHVANTRDFVETAKEEIGAAGRYQIKARKKMIICGIIAVVVVMILILVIVFSV